MLNGHDADDFFKQENEKLIDSARSSRRDPGAPSISARRDPDAHSCVADTMRLHVIMIYVSLLLVIVSIIFHFIRPDDQYFMAVGLAAIGFLFGKFTNSFGGGRRNA